MKIYPENYIVALTVPYTDLNGSAIDGADISTISAVLTDENDQLVVDLGSLSFAPLDTSVVISVAAEYNQLADDQLQAARVLRVSIATSAGVIPKSFSYIIEGTFRIELMNNSFLTFEAAELMARGFTAPGWAGATDEAKNSALIEAFSRLTQMSMKYLAPNVVVARFADDEIIILANEWPDMTIEDFMQTPTIFQRAVRRAQFVEANELLEGDTIAKKHRQGIISETIGKSSMMLRGTYVDYGISTSAMKELAGFIYYNFRVMRAS